MRQPVQVCVFIARRAAAGWDYLLLKRVARGDDFWQGVSGGVGDEETPAAAARREMLEETGLTPLRLEDAGHTYTFPLAEKWRDLYEPDVTTIREHVFFAEVAPASQPVLDPRAHDRYCWRSLDDALALLCWPENIAGLRHVHQRFIARTPGVSS